MNRDDLYKAFLDVDDEILERSEMPAKCGSGCGPERGTKRASERALERGAKRGSVCGPERGAKRGVKSAWSKRVAVAACLCLTCLAVGLSVPFLQSKGVSWHESEGTSWHDDVIPPINVFEHNGAYYEVVDMDDADTLARFNLPHEITDDMVGSTLGFVADPGNANATYELYPYVPYADVSSTSTQSSEERVQRAVYVVEDERGYAFALFCNFIAFDSNTHTEASEMFAVYGVDEAADIASFEVGGKTIADPAAIAEIYGALVNALSMGNDDFQNEVLGGMSEEDQQVMYVELADSMVEISAVTTSGLAMNGIQYYPTIGYVYWGLSYYHVDSLFETAALREVG